MRREDGMLGRATAPATSSDTIAEVKCILKVERERWIKRGSKLLLKSVVEVLKIRKAKMSVKKRSGWFVTCRVLLQRHKKSYEITHFLRNGTCRYRQG